MNFRLKLICQVHYNKSYHQVLGMQLLANELKRMKSKFVDSELQSFPNSTSMSRNTVEWLNKMFVNIKEHMNAAGTSGQLPEKIAKKISKLWKSLFGTTLDDVSGRTPSFAIPVTYFYH